MEEKKMDKMAESIMESIKNKISASDLTQIVKDWQNQFPDLKRHKSSQKLLKRSGPVIYGIELEKYLSSEYRPRVVLYNLLATESSLGAVIDQTFRSNDNIQISVKYSEHSNHILPTSDLIRQQSRIKLLGKINIEEAINGIVDYIKFDISSNCFWSCRAVMQLSRLIEDKNIRDKYFEDGYNLLVKKVPNQLLEMQTNGIENWKNEIKNLTVERINFLIEENIKKFGFENIPE